MIYLYGLLGAKVLLSQKILLWYITVLWQGWLFLSGFILALEDTESILAVRSCDELGLCPNSVRWTWAAQQLCPPHRACHNGKPAVRIIDALFCSLGFSLLTTPHLGLFLLWILIFLNMSVTNVCTSLYSVRLMSSIYLIYIETSAGILIGKDLVSCLNNCKCSTGNKNNVLVSFLCELASHFFWLEYISAIYFVKSHVG